MAMVMTGAARGVGWTGSCGAVEGNACVFHGIRERFRGSEWGWVPHCFTVTTVTLMPFW